MKKLLCLFVALGSTLCRPQETVSISGTVVDEAGKPLAGATVGATWVPKDRGETGAIKMSPASGTTSNSSGRFSFERQVYSGKFPVMAVSADGRLGALSILEPKALSDLTLRLEPMGTLKARLGFEDSSDAPEYVSAVVWVGSLGGPILFQGSSNSPEINLALPAGKYYIGFEGKDAQSAGREVVLDAEHLKLDLGVITVKKALLPSLYGKQAPELQFSQARGLPPSYKLEDSRGKWVILEFWGFW